MICSLPELPVAGTPDVLVVGAGPAGLALATGLADRGARVLVLESGGAQSAVDPLSEIETTGLPFPGAYAGRGRGLGGTSELWAGQCRPLDPLDLAQRSWISGSGWPLTPAELAPWVDRASDFFGLGAATYTPADIVGALELPAIDPHLLGWRILRYSPQRRVGSRLRSRLAADPLVTVATDATVLTLLRAPGDADRICGVQAATRTGQARELRAPEVVLAGGALENARLLLLTGEDGRPVPGDAGGRVGRGLQDHPHWLVGEISGADPRLSVAFQSARADGGRARAKLALPPARQEAAQTLNAVVDLELAHGPRSAVGAAKRLFDAYQQRRRPAAPVRELARIAADPRTSGRELVSRLRGTGSPADRHTRLLVRVQCEQPPTGESRVSLSAMRDALGCRRAAVHWTVGERERRTVLETTRLVGEAFDSAGVGHLVPDAWLDDAAQFPQRAGDFYHHAGTTRMSVDPADGVVDPDCAVHGTSGLHVVGGSVFPTSGYANPTLTIVALALRLAAHLDTGHLDTGHWDTGRSDSGSSSA